MISFETDNEKGFAPCPDSIAVIGGGRWARVLTEVLLDLVPPSVGIFVHSPHNSTGMSAWVSERGFGQRIHVSSGLPDFLAGRSNAVIVANAARDHEKAIEWALSAGVPVLIEKPVALTAMAAQRLSNLARSQKTYFAAAHVFLFARYVERFSGLVAEGDSIRFIRMNWMDPQFENRYGEAKSYDPGLPIFSDLLPHVLSIVGTVTSWQSPKCERLEFLRGGARLEIELVLGDVPCSVRLVRNGNHRQRIIEVTTQQKAFKLDFSSEPGTITTSFTTICGDPDWKVEEKPVARMLRAFLRGAAGEVLDNRLDIDIGLRACEIIDQTSVFYRLALLPWLTKKLLMISEEVDSDLRYALSEIIYAEDPFSSISVKQRINYICRQLLSGATPLSKNVLTFNDPVELIKLILAHGKPKSYN